MIIFRICDKSNSYGWSCLSLEWKNVRSCYFTYWSNSCKLRYNLIFSPLREHLYKICSRNMFVCCPRTLRIKFLIITSLRTEMLIYFVELTIQLNFSSGSWLQCHISLGGWMWFFSLLMSESCAPLVKHKKRLLKNASECNAKLDLSYVIYSQDRCRQPYGIVEGNLFIILV